MYLRLKHQTVENQNTFYCFLLAHGFQYNEILCDWHISKRFHKL